MKFQKNICSFNFILEKNLVGQRLHFFGESLEIGVMERNYTCIPFRHCNCLKKREGYSTDVIYAMDNLKLLVGYSWCFCFESLVFLWLHWLKWYPWFIANTSLCLVIWTLSCNTCIKWCKWIFWGGYIYQNVLNCREKWRLLLLWGHLDLDFWQDDDDGICWVLKAVYQCIPLDRLMFSKYWVGGITSYDIPCSVQRRRDWFTLDLANTVLCLYRNMTP